MSDRKVTLRYSRDGGRNWSSLRERDLGELGEYRKRVIVNRLGGFRTASIAIRVSSPVKATILGATAQITPSER